MTKGKVLTFVGGVLVCTFLDQIYVWKLGRVRTGTKIVNKCDLLLDTFDVTVTSQTASKLVPGYVFDLEYDDSVAGAIKPVLMFAGQPLQLGTAAFSAVQAGAAGGSPSEPPGGSPSSAPPQ